MMECVPARETWWKNFCRWNGSSSADYRVNQRVLMTCLRKSEFRVVLGWVWIRLGMTDLSRWTKFGVLCVVFVAKIIFKKNTFIISELPHPIQFHPRACWLPLSAFIARHFDWGLILARHNHPKFSRYHLWHIINLICSLPASKASFAFFPPRPNKILFFLEHKKPPNESILCYKESTYVRKLRNLFLFSLIWIISFRVESSCTNFSPFFWFIIILSKQATLQSRQSAHLSLGSSRLRIHHFHLFDADELFFLTV